MTQCRLWTRTMSLRSGKRCSPCSLFGKRWARNNTETNALTLFVACSSCKAARTSLATLPRTTVWSMACEGGGLIFGLSSGKTKRLLFKRYARLRPDLYFPSAVCAVFDSLSYDLMWVKVPPLSSFNRAAVSVNARHSWGGYNDRWPPLRSCFLTSW